MRIGVDLGGTKIEGIALDDIEVAPLCCVDGAEQEGSDWAAEGWSRLLGVAAQRWSAS